MSPPAAATAPAATSSALLVDSHSHSLEEHQSVPISATSAFASAFDSLPNGTDSPRVEKSTAGLQVQLQSMSQSPSDSRETVNASATASAGRAASAATAANESAPLSRVAPLTPIDLSDEHFVSIAPATATAAAAACERNDADAGEGTAALIRPPVPAELALNLVAQWHRTRDNRKKEESTVTSVLSVLVLVATAAAILLLLYFFYDILGMPVPAAVSVSVSYKPRVAYRIQVNSPPLPLLTVYIFFGFFLFYSGVALTACVIKLLDLSGVPQPRLFFYR